MGTLQVEGKGQRDLACGTFPWGGVYKRDACCVWGYTVICVGSPTLSRVFLDIPTSSITLSDLILSLKLCPYFTGEHCVCGIIVKNVFSVHSQLGTYVYTLTARQGPYSVAKATSHLGMFLGYNIPVS